MVDFTIDFAVPSEMLVGGMVHDNPPTIINGDFEVGDLREIFFRKVKIIVKPVFV